MAAKASHFGSNTVPSGLSMLVDDDAVVADVSDVAAYAVFRKKNPTKQFLKTY